MSTLGSLDIIPFESASLWEGWLAENHARSQGIWLQIYKKASGKQTVTYAEALDEALCYGWIDGQKQKHDEQSWLQKFTPRRPRSIWSKNNTRNVERLMEAGKIKPAGLKEVETAKRDGRWDNAYVPIREATLPEDFLRELTKDPKAQAFFGTLNQAHTFAIAYRLQSAKKPETRERRMKAMLDMLSRGEKLYG
jgi:uncharacterized protein YdeI (YjbR/CyaY-like superfamily)